MERITKEPFFSVIIPVCNKEPHIARSINSVLNQSFEDFELIVVCDPSTDNSNAEVEKFTDPRVRIFYRDRPGPGGYAARNLGIKKAKADWIAFLDADDEWCPEHLENYYRIVSENKEVRFLSSAYQIKNENGEIKNDAFYDSLIKKENQSIDFLKYLQLTAKGFRPAWTSVVCMKNTSSVQNVFPDGKAKRGGDQYAWIYYMSKEKNMVWSSSFGAIYHKDSVNMVTKSTPSNPSIFNYEYEVIKESLSREETKYLERYINRRLAGSYFRNRIENNIKICDLPTNLFFKNDKFFYILNVLFYFLPVAFYQLFKKVKKALV